MHTRIKFFNNEQVTCVGARVMAYAIFESDHALIKRGEVQLSAKRYRLVMPVKIIKLKSLILAQIERWRHA